jgi:hypothetical protein
MNIPRSTQFVALQLHKMSPTYHIIISKDMLEAWGEGWTRITVSRLNTQFSIYLQCHKNKDGSLTIWHNPEPKPVQRKSAAFDKLVWLREKLEGYRLQKAEAKDPNAYLAEMLATQEQIDATLIDLQYNEGDPRKLRGNAVHQPLPVILEFYGLTEAIWKALPKRLQLQKKIQAEVAIKNRRRAEEAK